MAEKKLDPEKATDEELTGRTYQVTGEYVLVKTMTPDGERVMGRYKGTPVPGDASAEWLRHHLRGGLIEPLPEGTAPPPPVVGGVDAQVAAQGAPDTTAEEPAKAEPKRAGTSAGQTRKA